MADYGHDLLFGIFVTPAADAPGSVVQLARRADDAGLDLVSVQDHPYQPAFLDTWTLLTTIAAATSRVSVFPNVANLPLRPPAILARSVASLDILSGGRAELGIGAGAFWDAIAAMGGPRRTPGSSVGALREAIAVIRALWTPGRGSRVDGEHYSLAGAKPGPFPVHDVGIWVGGYKQRMLLLTGELADGWLPSSPYAPPEQLAAMNSVIDTAAAEAGRSPTAVRRLYNIAGSFSGNGTEFLQGPPKVWAEQLAGLALDEGISGFILMADDAPTIERYAAEVAPAVREIVESERRSARVQTTAADTAGSRDAPPQGAPPQGAAPETAAVARAPRTSGGLGVEPTPDSGVRLSLEVLWDETERPAGPAPDPQAQYTDSGRASARELITVHDHLRGELAQLRDLIAQVAGGSIDPGAARSAISRLTMRQNQWTVGAYCENYCRFVGLHHTLEDSALFPGLRRMDGHLAPVVGRLHSEHEAIAGVLTRIDAGLVAMVTDPVTGMPELEAAVDLLTDALLSHLSYEERELVEPLARFGPSLYG